jgi:hypothetical protein
MVEMENRDLSMRVGNGRFLSMEKARESRTLLAGIPHAPPTFI